MEDRKGNDIIAARMQFQYPDGQDDAVDLGVGSFTLGIAGGPADIPLESKNLSRRHAVIVVGETLAECTVQDLGSTNKSSFVDDDGGLMNMEPNKVYNLAQSTELLFGDVGALFEFIGVEQGVAGIDREDSSKNLEQTSDIDAKTATVNGQGSVDESFEADSKPSKSVDFVLPESSVADRLEVDSYNSNRSSAAESKGILPRPRSSDSKANNNIRPRSSATTATSGTWIIPEGEEKIEHRLVYEHAREALGMDLPYDRELLWIAEMSLKMPLPEGWSQRSDSDSFEHSGAVLYFNSKLQVEVNERPQTIICRNMYKESKRKMQLEASVGAVFDEEGLPRLLLVDRTTGLDLFHYILPGRNTVGKGFGAGKADLVDITLNSRACSRRHSYIELREGRFFLLDLDSTNGTFIGEFPNTASRRIDPGTEVEVFDGQLIMFGDVECTLVAPLGGAAFYATSAAPAADAPSAQTREGEEHYGRTPDLSQPSAPRDGTRSGQEQPRDLNAAGGGAGGVDYDIIRKIIREEMSGTAGYLRSLQPPADAPPPPPAGPPPPPPVASREAAARGEEEEERRQEEERDVEQALRRVAAPPPPAPMAPAVRAGAGAGWDGDEEVRLADELSSLEAAARDTLGGAAGQGSMDGGGGKAGRGAGGKAPSKQEGFLARQEARRVRILEWAKQHYRRQAPLDALGPHLLPTGALHRILAALAPVPHLLLVAPVCRALRRAAYVTAPWQTVNGDRYDGLWGSLRLSGTRCGDGHTLVASLGAARLGAVRELDLSGVSTVSDATLAAVAEACPLLEVLLLQCRVDVGPRISDTGIEDVAACCPRLRQVSLTWCTRLTDFGFKALARDCGSLEALDASFCFQMTDAGLLDLVARCPALASLRLESCDRLSESALVAAAQRATSLRTLSLAGCVGGATTGAVIQVARSCALLTHVDLTGVSGLEDAGVWQLSRGCRWLKELLLAWCLLVSDTALVQVAHNCPLLTLLSVRGCPRVTDAAVVKLAHKCCYLTELDLRGCELVSQSGMDALAMMLPACTIHFLDKKLVSLPPKRS